MERWEQWLEIAASGAIVLGAFSVSVLILVFAWTLVFPRCL